MPAPKTNAGAESLMGSHASRCHLDRRGISFLNGTQMTPIGCAIIPRGDTEINKNQHVMNSVAEREERSRATTHVLYKHVHLSRLSVVCE